MAAIAFDPQTSGGLLIALPEQQALALVAELQAAGDLEAAVVGRVVEQTGFANRELRLKAKRNVRLRSVHDRRWLGRRAGEPDGGADSAPRVALAEERYLGGTCVNVGCIPKKLLIYACELRGRFQGLGRVWLEPGRPRLRLATLIANKDREIARLNGVYERSSSTRGSADPARARDIADAHTVVVGGERYTARYILLSRPEAGRPRRQIPGGELAITSNEAFFLPQFPARVLRRGRRLYRGRIRGNFPRPRREGRPGASRRTVPARLRRRRSAHAGDRDEQAGNRASFQQPGRTDRKTPARNSRDPRTTARRSKPI